MTSVAVLATQGLADWCAVYTLDASAQRFQLLAMEHRDPERRARVRELQERYLPDPAAANGIAKVLRTGQSELYPELPDAWLAAIAQNDEHLQAMRDIGFASLMHVPLIAHAQTFGVISFGLSDPLRHYDTTDLALAEEVGRRAAQAIDNARLYELARAELAERQRAEEALQELNAQLEQRVQDRTLDLERANVELRSEIEERQRAEDALRHSERRYRSLLDLAPDMIILFDRDARIIEANARASEMLGYSLEEMRAMVITDFIDLRGCRTMRCRRSTPVPPGATRTSERMLRRKDGSTFPTEVNSVILPGQMMQSIVRDITARTAAAEQLQQAKTEAEQANRAKSEFLSRMSHELRTPLNAILGFAQILEMAALTPRQTEGVGYILKGGRHLLALINEVLDISRIEAGHIELSLEPVAVPELIQQVADLVQPLAGRRQVALDLPADLPDVYVLADRQRISQVLLNLLSNAIKYNHEGGNVRLQLRAGRGAPLPDQGGR